MNKHIEQWLEQHEKERVNLLACATAIGDVTKVVEDKEIVYINVYSSYGVTMNVTIKVDSLREVSPIARQLAKYGIRINHSYKPEASKTGKTYYFNLPSTQLDYKGAPKMELLSFSVQVRGNGEGANCKYIQVGEKTVPIMEWKCDDGTGTTNEADVPEEVG
jgi:hypothetical protein